MRKNTIYSFILILSLIGIGIFDYQIYIQRQPCRNPINYKIGTIDPKFGVSRTIFQNDITQASTIWSKAIGKQLFTYSPTGSLTINLVYDSRQQITQNEQILNSSINQNSQVASSIKEQYSELESKYTANQQTYLSELAQFNQDQMTYNNQVSYWNNAGGAPKAEYNKLTAEKNSLQAQRDSLDEKRVALNQLGVQINTFIDKYNLLVSHINSDVNTINNDGLAGTQFEEGVYIYDDAGTRINIYQFENQTDLIRVLAHELGHAIGLAHNSNPNSIMNPVNQGTNLSLTTDDLNELKTECGIK